MPMFARKRRTTASDDSDTDEEMKRCRPWVPDSDSDFDDDEKRYRRERLNLPRPLDSWLAAAVVVPTKDLGPGARLIIPKMARCMLSIEWQQGLQATSADGIFDDSEPDTFTLHVTAIIMPGLPRVTCDQVSPRVILDQWQGRGTALCAPDWVRWPLGIVRERWCERAYITDKFMRLAIDRMNLEVPHLSVQMTQWAIAAARGSAKEKTVHRVAQRRGFVIPQVL